MCYAEWLTISLPYPSHFPWNRVQTFYHRIVKGSTEVLPCILKSRRHSHHSENSKDFSSSVPGIEDKDQIHICYWLYDTCKNIFHANISLHPSSFIVMSFIFCFFFSVLFCNYTSLNINNYVKIKITYNSYMEEAH